MSTPDRVFKPKVPRRLIFTSVLIALTLLAGIFYATWFSVHKIEKAKMTGVIVKKEFTSKPEQQVTIGRNGDFSAQHVDGEYTFTVEVPQEDGTKKPYQVWLPKKFYDDYKVGDSFNVGPYYVPSEP